VGGNGWHQTGAWQQDLSAAFRQEQDQELAQDNHGFAGRTIEELWKDEDWRKYILTGGTCGVLDQIKVVDPTHSEEGPFMRPLTGAEVRAWCPGGQPTHTDWLDAMESGRLPFPEPAGGHCTVLYRNGQPAQVGYWGVTAD
jgi:hypothetical protein